MQDLQQPELGPRLEDHLEACGLYFIHQQRGDLKYKTLATKEYSHTTTVLILSLLVSLPTIHYRFVP